VHPLAAANDDDRHSYREDAKNRDAANESDDVAVAEKAREREREGREQDDPQQENDLFLAQFRH
jgi:hypothetical protein